MKNAFVVGYVGQLHTLGMDKGVGELVEALAECAGRASGAGWRS